MHFLMHSGCNFLILTTFKSLFIPFKDDTLNKFIAFSGQGQSLRKKGRKPWRISMERLANSHRLTIYFVTMSCKVKTCPTDTLGFCCLYKSENFAVKLGKLKIPPLNRSWAALKLVTFNLVFTKLEWPVWSRNKYHHNNTTKKRVFLWWCDQTMIGYKLHFTKSMLLQFSWHLP